MIKHQFIVMVSERIGNEYFTNEYTGIGHWNRNDAEIEYTKACDEFKNDPYANVYIREVGG